MDYTILIGEIQQDVLYQVTGEQSVTYNGITYNNGQFFRGVQDVSVFTYWGTGTQILIEIIELKGSSIEQVENEIDYPVFHEITLLQGFALEYELNSSEEIVNEMTIIQGFALELIDYPFYCFEIMESRL